ncbi:MAG: DUF4352 domain-containing protein [Corynebacterium sp.]|nr:DUF4352 domain-containing protein [Corynebacterium sp.]
MRNNSAFLVAGLVLALSSGALWACSSENNNAESAVSASSAAQSQGTGLVVESFTTRQNLVPVDTELSPGVHVTEAQAPAGQSFVEVNVRITNNSERAWIPNGIATILHTEDGNTYAPYEEFENYVSREAGHFLAPGASIETCFIFEVPTGAQPVSLSFSNSYGDTEDSGELPLSSL